MAVVNQREKEMTYKVEKKLKLLLFQVSSVILNANGSKAKVI